MQLPTKEEARARFWELKALVDAAKEALAPVRAELGDLVAGDTKLTVKQAIAREADIRAAIDAAQADLHPLEMELAMCVRLCGGIMGDAPEAPGGGAVG